MKINGIDVELGTTVSYEDMANPRKVGTVAEIETDEIFGVTQYRVEFEHEGSIWSDLKQAGWKAYPEMIVVPLNSLADVEAHLQAKFEEEGV